MVEPAIFFKGFSPICGETCFCLSFVDVVVHFDPSLTCCVVPHSFEYFVDSMKAAAKVEPSNWTASAFPFKPKITQQKRSRDS